MDTIPIRKMIDQVIKKFGKNIYIELHTDGSGRILTYPPLDLDWEDSVKQTRERELINFGGLGELAEICGKE